MGESMITGIIKKYSTYAVLCICVQRISRAIYLPLYFFVYVLFILESLGLYHVMDPQYLQR
jgi:hypothetical protein